MHLLPLRADVSFAVLENLVSGPQSLLGIHR